MRPSVLPAAALAALLLLGSPPAAAREISGSRTVTGELAVEEGETLTLLPGTTLRFRGGRLLVRGVLVTKGSPSRPVRISGDDAWEGVDVRGKDGSRLSGTVLSGGRRALSVVNARVALDGVTFRGSPVGLEAGQYARVEAKGCRFEGGKVGALVKRGGAAAFDGCRFEGASRAGLYVYGAKDVSARRSRFVKNGTGLLVSMLEGSASVAECSFEGNGTGLMAEKMGSPAVSGGDFTGNGTGLLFTRRASGTVTGARIEGNGDGVRVEYSSYPVFRENRFRGNRAFAVRLVHQSSQWEEAATGEDREGAAGGAPFGGAPEGRGDFRPGGPPGASSGSPGPPPGAGPPSRGKGAGDGTVDFRGNDWGPGGADGGGPGGGRAVHDGADEPWFEYKGKRYRMDRVLH